jgi:hypothetical protein
MDIKNTKDTDNDRVKQSSCRNFRKDMTNNLWPTKLFRKARIFATMVDACLFQRAVRPAIAAGYPAGPIIKPHRAAVKPG